MGGEQIDAVNNAIEALQAENAKLKYRLDVAERAYDIMREERDEARARIPMPKPSGPWLDPVERVVLVAFLIGFVGALVITLLLGVL